MIHSVYLFEARRLLEDLRARGVKIRPGSSVRRELWTAAQVCPESRNALVLSQEQRDLFALFGPVRGINGSERPIGVQVSSKSSTSPLAKPSLLRGGAGRRSDSRVCQEKDRFLDKTENLDAGPTPARP